MTIGVEYAISYGNHDYADWLPHEITLTPDENSLFEGSVRLFRDLNDVSGLQDVPARAYQEIKENILDFGIMSDSEYVMKCDGSATVDPDEINDCVAGRDPHTLEFFGLEDLSEEELDAWDAHSVDLPTVAEFDEDFEPIDPFDDEWLLEVRFCEIEHYARDLTEEDARDILTELFQAADGDYSEISGFVKRADWVFSNGFPLSAKKNGQQYSTPAALRSECGGISYITGSSHRRTRSSPR